MDVNNYQMLYECYMSEQMSDEQLVEHFRVDPDFEQWFLRKCLELGA